MQSNAFKKIIASLYAIINVKPYISPFIVNGSKNIVKNNEFSGEN